MATIIGRIAISLLLLGNCVASPQPLEAVTLQLTWVPSAQDAGFYAAEDTGVYAEAGLAVAFVAGGPNVDRIQPVLDGSAQFGVAGADELILARSQGKPVRALATIYRRSPIVFITLADSGITHPRHFAGHTIRVTANVVPSLHAMTARFGVAPEEYTEVVLPSSVEGFAQGNPPIWAAYVIGLALAVREAGHEINLIAPDDYGIHFYADTLFTTDALIQERPELVERFVRASLQGWQWAVRNPDRVGALVAAHGTGLDEKLETARMIASLPLVNTGEDHIGWMQPAVWEAMADTLTTQNVLRGTVEISQVYTIDFLRKIYENQSEK